MFLAAARRFLALLVLTGVPTVLVSLFLGLLAGSTVDRSVSVGLYLVGSFFLLAGFFVGNRGPIRLKRDEGAGLIPFTGSRLVRWATMEEQEQSLNTSAVYVVLGFVMIMIGIAIDSRYSLW